MKILQITPYFLPHNGGIERYVYNLSGSLVQNGHEVEIWTSNIPETKEEEELNGIRVRRFKCFGTPLRNPIVPGFFRAIKRDIQDFDLIHAHMIYSTAAISGIYMKQKSGLPLVITHHGRMIFEEPWKDMIVSVYEKLFIKEILKGADRIVALSNSDSEFLGSFNKINKINVIPNGIDIIKKDPQPDLDFDQFLMKNEIFNKNIIFFAGRLIESKGLNFLIDSIDKYKSNLDNSNFIVVIAGKGPHFKNLQFQCQRYKLTHLVKFIGDLPFCNIIKIYHKSKIFILPSISEGFPTTVLEAMYFGIPVIATDIPVMRQYFSDTAILVPPRDPVCLGKAILYLMQNPDIGRELSRKGKEKVIKEFTWDKIVQQYLKLYNELQFNNKRKEDE